MNIQKLKAISIALLIPFLSGCRNIPFPSRDVERCSLFINKVGGDLYAGKCRCHDYRVSRKFVGRVTEPVDRPVEYCKRLVGFRPTEWTDVFVPWFDELQILSNQEDKEIQEIVDDNAR